PQKQQSEHGGFGLLLSLRKSDGSCKHSFLLSFLRGVESGASRRLRVAISADPAPGFNGAVGVAPKTVFAGRHVAQSALVVGVAVVLASLLMRRLIAGTRIGSVHALGRRAILAGRTALAVTSSPLTLVAGGVYTRLSALVAVARPRSVVVTGRLCCAWRLICRVAAALAGGSSGGRGAATAAQGRIPGSIGTVAIGPLTGRPCTRVAITLPVSACC